MNYSFGNSIFQILINFSDILNITLMLNNLIMKSNSFSGYLVFNKLKFLNLSQNIQIKKINSRIELE